MEFGVCAFLAVDDVTRLLMTCKQHQQLPLPYMHLVPKWCQPWCAKTVAMLHGGYARELVNVHDMSYNLCCELPDATLFVGTYNTCMPLKIDSQWKMTYAYLGLRDVFDVCSVSNGDVVVANACGTLRYDISFDAKHVKFTEFTFRRILSVHCQRLVYGVSCLQSSVVRVHEDSHECQTVTVMRNPIIAVTDAFLYVASCLDPSNTVYFVEHDKISLRSFAVFPSTVLQLMGLPNGKIAVRCSNLKVYLFEHSQKPLVFNMGAGHMVRIGDVIYCKLTCLCTTTNRLYYHRSGNNYIGDCRPSAFSLCQGLRIAMKRNII